MVKNAKTAITFFSGGGILDMVFYATWPTIGDNALEELSVLVIMHLMY